MLLDNHNYNKHIELFQRAEFLSNIYAAGPKSQSTITAATQPQTSPLAQSIGTGISIPSIPRYAREGLMSLNKFKQTTVSTTSFEERCIKTY